MVDAPNSQFDPQPVVPVTEEKRANLLTSTVGKVIIGVVALVLVLVVIGVALWFFMFATPADQAAQVTNRAVNPAGATATSATADPAGATPITDPQEKPLESTFTFRNVFAPTLKRPTPESVIESITAPATSTSGSSSTDVKVPADTLYLVSIQTVDGAKTASFIWNGATYSLGEGDTLSGTPWKVVEIGDSSVVMLYGDTQVSLSTGQGLSK